MYVSKDSIAIYPGSFDPFTKGHEDILINTIRLKLFKSIIILVAPNHIKEKSFMNIQDRLNSICDYIDDKFSSTSRLCVDVLQDKVATVDYAKFRNASTIIRGVRTFKDFEFENGIIHANKLINPEINTILLTADIKNQLISSTIVRELIYLNKIKEAKELIPNKIFDYMVAEKYINV